MKFKIVLFSIFILFFSAMLYPSNKCYLEPVIVKEGDSLWKLAEKHFNDGDMAKMFWTISKTQGLTSNPDLIYPGMVLYKISSDSTEVLDSLFKSYKEIERTVNNNENHTKQILSKVDSLNDKTNEHITFNVSDIPLSVLNFIFAFLISVLASMFFTTAIRGETIRKTATLSNKATFFTAFALIFILISILIHFVKINYNLLINSFDLIFPLIGIILSFIMLKISKETLDESIRPSLTCYIEQRGLGLFLIVKNIGIRTAENVKLTFKPKLESAFWNQRNEKIPFISNNKICLNGIAPYQATEYFFDTTIARFQSTQNQIFNYENTFIIQAIYHYRGNKYTDKITVDISYLVHTGEIDTNKEVKENIKIIKKDLSSIKESISNKTE